MFGKLLLLLWYIENYEYYANKTETDYRAALKSMELFFDASIGTSESDEADILCLLIDDTKNNITLLKRQIPLKL